MDAPPPPPPPPPAVSAPAPQPPGEVVVADLVIVRADRPLAGGDKVFSVVALAPETLAADPRLDEALATQPGVSLFRRTSSLGANPTTQGLSLRGIAGSGAGRALVTLDRIPQNDPFGGWVIWSALPSEAISRAQIVRGAGSGPYGAGALTGAVTLWSGGRTQLSVSGGELGQTRVAGALSWGLADDFFLSASGGHSDGWVPVHAGAGAADRRLSLDYGNVQGRAGWQIGGGILQLDASAFREARGSGLAGAASRTQGGQFGVSYLSRGALPLRAAAWVSTSDLRNTSVSVAAGRATTTPANSQDSTPAFGYGANLALQLTPGRWTLELGADARGAEGEDRERFRVIGGAYTRRRVAGGANLDVGLYLDGDWQDGDWTLGGGLRLDRWSSFNGKRLERDLATGATTLDHRPGDRDGLLPTARFGVKRALQTWYYVRAAAYAGFRPPTLNELHRPFRVGNDITEANPDLSPERLYGLEVGVGHEDSGLDWSLTLFANRLADPVTNVTVGVGPFTDPIAGFVPAGGVLRQRRNAGRIDAWGVEGEGHWATGEALTLRAAFSYTHARVDGRAAAPQLTGLRPAETPELTVTAGADWKVAGPFSLHADVRGESVRYDDDLNTRRLAPSVSLDVQADWALGDKASVYLALDNAADADVQTGRTADGVVSYGPPRAVRAGLRVSF